MDTNDNVCVEVGTGPAQDGRIMRIDVARLPGGIAGTVYSSTVTSVIATPRAGRGAYYYVGLVPSIMSPLSSV